MSLVETQRLLWTLITAPEGAAAFLDQVDARNGPERQKLTSIVRDGHTLGALECVDVYGQMYFFRILDVLREDFPAVAELLGHDRFHNLVTDYLLTVPPSNPSLREAGRNLADFIGQHPIRADYPFLAELARFEWMIFETFDAPDGPTVAANDLQSVPAQHWGALLLSLHPSVTLASFEWPVRRLHAEILAGACGDLEKDQRTPERIIVWRKEFRVFHREIEVDEWTALSRISAGDSFDAVCETIAHTCEKNSETRLAALLARWLGDGLIGGVDLQPDRS